MKHIVGFSGGIDSQACAPLGPEQICGRGCDPHKLGRWGNEHPITTQFLKDYSRKHHKVTYVNAIIADMWKTPGYAETVGPDGSEKLTFDLMCEMKKRAPTRLAQFCTEILKLRPQKRWIEKHFGPKGKWEGEAFTRYTGVRRDESPSRREAAFTEWDDFYDCELVRPIADFTKEMCFDYVEAHGEEVNPLYKLGFSRVGCAPCIHSSKEDIRLWFQRAPEMIDKIRGWEQGLRRAASMNGGRDTNRTFFPPMVPGLATNDIDEVVKWALTKHGGKELLPILERPSCESKYGLCA